MPNKNIQWQTDKSGNGKNDRTCTVDNNRNVFIYNDINEDGLVDIFTDYSNKTNTVWDKNGNKTVYDNIDEAAISRAFQIGKFNPDGKVNMPTDNVFRAIDYNANNKNDRIFTLNKENFDIYSFADVDEDGLTDILTDYSNRTTTVWDKDGKAQTYKNNEYKNDGAFELGSFMLSQRVNMPTENIFSQFDDKNENAKYLYTIAEDTGWVVQYKDANEDGVADSVWNMGHGVKMEWLEDGTCVASRTTKEGRQGMVDTNCDNKSDFTCQDKDNNGIWDFLETQAK